MSTATRRSLQVSEPVRNRVNSNGARQANGTAGENAARESSGLRKALKPRVFVAAENRLLREALSRMLIRSGEIEVIGRGAAEPSHTEDLLREKVDILLFSSRGSRDEDLAVIRRVRSAAPQVLILLIDVAGDETDFLQCIRAGVGGYLPRDASPEDVVESVRAVQAGKAVCPGHFARHCSGISSGRQPLFLLRACVNGWV
jgi:DNA-binding NarL/FixJ family response regulator